MTAESKSKSESGSLTPGPLQVELSFPVTNLNRTVGTMLSYEISKAYGEEGLPEDTIKVKLEGHGGQSLGFALAKGVFLEVAAAE